VSTRVPVLSVPDIRCMRQELGLPAVEVVARLRAKGVKVSPSDLSRLEKAIAGVDGLAMQAARLLAEEAKRQGVAW